MTGAAEAESEAGRSRWAARTLVAVIFVNMLGFGVIVPLLPFYARSFQAAPWQVALVFSAYAAGAFFGEPFWGRLSDRYGRKPLLLSTVSGNCLCYLALAFAPNVYVALLVRFMGGMASGNGAVVQGYLADVTPPGARTRRLSMMGAAWNVGLIVGPSLGGLLARTDAGPAGFRPPLLVAAALAAISASAIALFVRESRRRGLPIETPASRWAAAGEAVRHPVVGRLMLLTFLVGCAFTGVESIFGLWTQARDGWGPREIGACFACVGLGAAATQIFVAGRLATRFGEARVLAAGMALTVVCAALQPFSPAGWVTVGLMTLTGIGQSVAFPNVGALISRSADPARQGQVLGLNNACGAAARVVGPFCAGLAFASPTRDLPFFLAAAATAPAVLLARAAGRRMRAVAPERAGIAGEGPEFGGPDFTGPESAGAPGRP